MLMLTPDVILALIDQAKFWIGFIGVIVFGGRIVGWFRAIRSKDLKEIHEGVSTTQSELVKQTDVLQKGFENMCSSHSRDIQELRSDFRTLFSYGKPVITAAVGRSDTPRRNQRPSARSDRHVPKKLNRKEKGK